MCIITCECAFFFSTFIHICYSFDTVFVLFVLFHLRICLIAIHILLFRCTARSSSFGVWGIALVVSFFSARSVFASLFKWFASHRSNQFFCNSLHLTLFLSPLLCLFFVSVHFLRHCQEENISFCYKLPSCVQFTCNFHIIFQFYWCSPSPWWD